MSSSPRVVMRSRFAIAGPAVVALAAVVVWVLQVRHGGLGELGRDGVVPLAALVGAVLWWLWPVVVLDDGGLLVRNLTRTHVIPWGAYDGVDTRWALKIKLKGRRPLTATACAATGGITRRDHVAPEIPEAYFYSDLPQLRFGADARSAGMLIERRSPRWQEEGLGPRVKTTNAKALGTEVRSTWNWAALAVLAAALAAIAIRVATIL